MEGEVIIKVLDERGRVGCECGKGDDERIGIWVY